MGAECVNNEGRLSTQCLSQHKVRMPVGTELFTFCHANDRQHDQGQG
jgi:hypothetical protein